MNKIVAKIFVSFVPLFMLSCQQKPVWQAIDDGLFVGEFKTSALLPFNDATITIIKVDPNIYDLQLLTCAEYHHDALTLPEWCKRYHLLGAINAGMYQEDFKTNVGYLKNYDYINNPRVNSSHHSLAAFNPVDSTDIPFFIFDIDDYAADSVIARYHSVVQNLRLIKSPRENRWVESTKRWCESALAQDKEGNALFIYCRVPLNMVDFNNALLQLPINIVAAMHVEGGQPASLYFSYNGVTKSYSGPSETKFDSEGNALNAAELPNVIGFSHKR